MPAQPLVLSFLPFSLRSFHPKPGSSHPKQETPDPGKGCSIATGASHFFLLARPFYSALPLRTRLHLAHAVTSPLDSHAPRACSWIMRDRPPPRPARATTRNKPRASPASSSLWTQGPRNLALAPRPSSDISTRSQPCHIRTGLVIQSSQIPAADSRALT